MKRKIVCTMLAFVLVFALSACGNDSKDAQADKPDPYTAFQEVQKNMKNIKDAEMHMKMDMDVAAQAKDTSSDKIDGGDTQVAMDATIKQVNKSKDDVNMEMTFKTSTADAAAAALSGSVYMKDKMLYMNTAGQKIKTDMDNDLVKSLTTDSNSLMDIQKEMITDIDLQTEGDNKVFNITMDINKALDYLKNNAGASKSAFRNLDDLSVKSMKMKMVADENNFVKTIDMDSTMSMSTGDEASDFNYKIAMEYKSINSGLTIDFPDFSDYKKTDL